MGRTIPMPRRERTTGGLEPMAHGGVCGAQRPRQFYTGRNPIEALLGYRPTLHPDQNVATNNQTAEQRIETLHQKRAQAIVAINKVANRGPTLEGKFKEGDQVW